MAITLGNNSETTLTRPTKEDLSGSLAVLLGDVVDGGMHEQRLEVLRLVPIKLNKALGTEGRVSGDGDAFLLGEGDEVGLDEVRVMFDLEDGDGNFGVAEDVHEEGTLEVGDADRADEFLFDEAFQGLPRFLDGDVDCLTPWSTPSSPLYVQAVG